jgi:hypothetical protein
MAEILWVSFLAEIWTLLRTVNIGRTQPVLAPQNSHYVGWAMKEKAGRDFWVYCRIQVEMLGT